MKEKIYLIPGLMTDERLWARLKPYLKEYDLIHLPIPLDEDLDNIIEDIDKCIDCEKINLLGFSLGGYIASYYALKKPQKINKLFLLSSTPSSTEEKDIARREKKLEEARKGAFSPLDEKKALELLEIRDDEALVKVTCDMFNELGKETFVCQLATTLKRVDILEQLKQLDIPIKFYHSSEDRLLSYDTIKKIKEENYNFEVVCREGTSHNIPLEFPYELSIEIKKWLEDK